MSHYLPICECDHDENTHSRNPNAEWACRATLTGFPDLQCACTGFLEAPTHSHKWFTSYRKEDYDYNAGHTHNSRDPSVGDPREPHHHHDDKCP